jgi:hypothetical protein
MMSWFKRAVAGYGFGVAADVALIDGACLCFFAGLNTLSRPSCMSSATMFFRRSCHVILLGTVRDEQAMRAAVIEDRWMRYIPKISKKFSFPSTHADDF